MARPPIVGRLTERIIRAIAKGKWPPGSSLPGTRRLASEFNVSPVTMLKAVHRLADQGLLDIRHRQPVRLLPGAAETAQRVLAPSPKAARTRRVAILVSDTFQPLDRNPFYLAVTNQVICEAEKQGLQAMVVWWPVREQLAVAESLWRTDYDAAVFVGFRTEYVASLFFLHEHRFPLLIFNHEVPGLKLPALILDLYAAAQKIAHHLVTLGHRNLCLVTDAQSHDDVSKLNLSLRRGMSHGWTDFLAEANLLEQCTMPLYTPWAYRTGLYGRIFKMVMFGSERPTAIVFSHSVWAKSFLLDPEFARFKVPADLSLATFDTTANILPVPWCPPLTNIDIDYVRTAQCIIEAVQKMLDDDLPQTIRVPLHLQITDSVGPAPSEPTLSESSSRKKPAAKNKSAPP